MSQENPSPAQRVFISYAHGDDDFQDRVLALADRLRDPYRVNAELDQYHQSVPKGWPTWMEDEIEASEFVLVICTETYLRRFRKREVDGKGLGATWEGAIITQELYDGQGRNEKFIPVLLSRDDMVYIPTILRAFDHYDVSTDAGYETLLRRLKKKPYTLKPDLAQFEPELPPRQRKQSFSPSQPLWSALPARNIWFKGREKILDELRTALTREGKAAISQGQAISGLGGVGKTQTAVEYAYRHRDSYNAVFWTKADNESALYSGYGDIARLLALPEKDVADQTEVRNAVKRWLAANGGWLILFDNADSPELLKPFLPPDHKGHILLTSRAHDFQALNIVKPQELIQMEPDDAVAFLLARTQLETATGDEATAARELAKELGYFPLALEQAAAYIVAKESSFRDYLKTYRALGVVLLKKHGPVAGDYSESVATTWELNFAEVEKTPPSAELLRVSAFFAPDDIPFELVIGGSAQIGSALGTTLSEYKQQPLLLDEVLDPLRKYSLISRNSEARTLSMHRLVQATMRDRMTQEDRRNYAERAVRAMNEAFPVPEFRNWQLCERMLPQAVACAHWIEELVFEFAEGAFLLNRAGVYLHQRGSYGKAESLFRRALAIREKALGPDHPDTSMSLNDLALSYHSQGRFADAEPLYRRALDIREKALGPDHPHTANSLNNLAALYQSQRRFADAEPLFRRALAICEKALPPDHPDIALVCKNLAAVLQELGRTKEATAMRKRAQAIREKRGA